jgi:dolichol-phosphate mannosyltransferase
MRPHSTDTAVALSVVVPTYNERDRLAQLIAAVFKAWQVSLEAAMGAAEVIVVDDNSPDGTGQKADDIATRYAVRVIHRPKKLGLGSAVMAGVHCAGGALVAVMDADLSHPPTLLPSLVRALLETGADFAVGSRYVAGGVNKDRLVRRVMSRTACRLARSLTPVRDATSGFFVVRKERVTRAAVSESGFKIGLDLFVRTNPEKIIEVPYVFVRRAAGKSKMGLREAIGYLQQLRQLSRFRSAQNGVGWPLHVAVVDRTAASGAPSNH